MDLQSAPEPTTSEDLPAVPVSKPFRFKALVVEDDLSSRLLLRGLLSRLGECHVAVNGKEAMQAFHSARDNGHPFDLICMDIHMPEMDGQEAVSQIRAVEHQENVDATGVKILMTSSASDVKTILASYAKKCDGYLTKPFDGKTLEDRLKSLGLIRPAAPNS